MVDLNDPNYQYVNVNILDICQNSNNFFASNPKVSLNKLIEQVSLISDDPNTYEMTIARFSCSIGSTLPIWCPRIDTTQSNPNQTIYKMTLSVIVNGVKYTSTQPIMYIPEDNTAIYTGQSNNILSDIFHYYYVYSYCHISYLFNNTVISCFNDLLAQIQVNNNGYAFTAQLPFMIFNENTSLYELYFDQNGEVFTLSFDSNLYGMFYSFYVLNGSIVVNNYNGLYSVNLNGRTYTKVVQSFITHCNWPPVRSIVFTSEKLPIVPEISILPEIFTDTLTINNDMKPLRNQKIITDFQIPYDKAEDCRKYTTYTPTIYKWISLTGRDSIRDLDINIFFCDRFSQSNDLVPICIPNSSDANLKLCFRKKQ